MIASKTDMDNAGPFTHSLGKITDFVRLGVSLVAVLDEGAILHSTSASHIVSLLNHDFWNHSPFPMAIPRVHCVHSSRWMKEWHLRDPLKKMRGDTALNYFVIVQSLAEGRNCQLEHL
jgi:hypothetical protein